MKTQKKYFFGNEISEHGIANGYVDYRTLAKCGDMVLCNDITKLFYNTIGDEYTEPEQVNGFIDNSDQIDELQEQVNELMLQRDDTDNEDEEKRLAEQIDELRERISDLEYEQTYQREVFQYYIISNNLVQILQDYTNEILYYIEPLDVYVWGVTHYGTSWDYVLTDIKIDW